LKAEPFKYKTANAKTEFYMK